MVESMIVVANMTSIRYFTFQNTFEK